jgi:hypothetical protein
MTESNGNGNGNGKFKLSPGIATQIIGWLIAALLTYGAVSERVAVLETRVNGLERQLERIEHKLDLALRLQP